MMSCVLLWKLHIKTFIIGPKIHRELISVCKGWGKHYGSLFLRVDSQHSSSICWKGKWIALEAFVTKNHSLTQSRGQFKWGSTSGLAVSSIPLIPLFVLCKYHTVGSLLVLGRGSWSTALWVFQSVLLRDCSGLLFRFVAFPRKRSDLGSFHIKSCWDYYWDCLVSIDTFGKFSFLTVFTLSSWTSFFPLSFIMYNWHTAPCKCRVYSVVTGLNICCQMITVTSLVHVHHLKRLKEKKRQKCFFPCDENF